MPWCPNCRTEYLPGIVRCADCDARLVDELPPEPKPDQVDEREFEPVLLATVIGQPHLALLRQALEQAGIQSSSQLAVDDVLPASKGLGVSGLSTYRLYVARRHLKRAREIYRAYEDAPSE